MLPPLMTLVGIIQLKPFASEVVNVGITVGRLLIKSLVVGSYKSEKLVALVILLVTNMLDENILLEAVILVDMILAALILVVTYTLPVATTFEVVTLPLKYTLPVATTFPVVTLLVIKELDENMLPEAVTFVDTILAALILVVTNTLPVATMLAVVILLLT